jgi:hypothetical protein
VLDALERSRNSVLDALETRAVGCGKSHGPKGGFVDLKASGWSCLFLEGAGVGVRFINSARSLTLEADEGVVEVDDIGFSGNEGAGFAKATGIGFLEGAELASLQDAELSFLGDVELGF